MAPGTLLFLMYLSNRTKAWPNKYKNFYEIGSGQGLLSKVFLDKGLKGCGFDLNKKACLANRKINSLHIKTRKYSIYRTDFLKKEKLKKVDIIISSMVLEHLNQKKLSEYFKKCKNLLNKGGLIISVVPANMRYWGIEDEIAGHVKRYSKQCLDQIAATHKLRICKLQGLTWPLSNLLLPLGNWLVAKHEKKLLKNSLQQRTIESGFRSVGMKTAFPFWWRFFVNEITLFPWYILQLLNQNLGSSTILYCEMEKK